MAPESYTAVQVWVVPELLDDATQRTLAAIKQSSKNLQELNLSGCPITDAGVVHLLKLSKLQSLYLNDTKVTDKGKQMLEKALPKAYISR